MSVLRLQQGNPTPILRPRCGHKLGRGLRGSDEVRGRGGSNRAARVQRIFGKTTHRRRVPYKIGDWIQDSMLEMVEVNPDNPTTHFEYHCRQGNSEHEPLLSISKASCRGSNHFYSQCPNIESDEEYYWV